MADTSPPSFKHLSLASDPAWSDITPLPQDDGPHPIARINYSDEFREVYDYVRAVLAADEVSERAFELSERAARLNPANYTVWHFRRRLLVALSKSVDQELRLLDVIIEMHSKNYQLWFHRQKIVERRGRPEGELRFVGDMLAVDGKNYHAWQYRHWLLRTFPALWQHELHYSHTLIQEDVRNNSAWNHRYFVITHTTEYTEEILAREVIYTLEAIDADVYNESPWNYLRGITQNLPSLPNYQLGPPYNCTLVEKIRSLIGSRETISPYLVMFACDCFEELLSKAPLEEAKSVLTVEVIPILEKLEKVDDTVRKNYWKFMQLKLEEKYSLVV